MGIIKEIQKVKNTENEFEEIVILQRSLQETFSKLKMNFQDERTQHGSNTLNGNNQYTRNHPVLRLPFCFTLPVWYSINCTRGATLYYKVGFVLGDFAQLQANIWEKAMAPQSSTLAWKIPWTEEPGRLQSMGSLRVGHD